MLWINYLCILENMILNLYKKRGETPLECINRFRGVFPEYQNIKMTYLGRLDPMAEGVLLVGTEEETKEERRKQLFGLNKDYEFSAIFGFKTDTYDCLGKITHPLTPPLTLREGETHTKTNISAFDLVKICKIYEGQREQEYPKYSSKIISSQEKTSSEKKIITIYKLQFKNLEKINSKELFGKLLMEISKIKGDFRQIEILEMWKDALIRKDFFDIQTAHFFASVSSGTYIRSVVNNIGNTLGCGATTLSIRRTRVGNYKVEDSIVF